MASNTVELAAKDLNREGGVYCPNPLAKMELWNAHPCVFLECGPNWPSRLPVLRYALPAQGGRARRGHHQA